MSEEKNASTSENAEIATKARELIVDISPIKFLRPHEQEALAEDRLAAGKPPNITPDELAEIIDKGDSLNEDLQRLVNEKQLRTQLSKIGFNKRELDLIGKSFIGNITFINYVVLPLLEDRDDYMAVYYTHSNFGNAFNSISRILGSQTPEQDKEKVPAKVILGHLAAEVQLINPGNKITALIIETLAKILPEEACEELSDTLRNILAA